MSLSVESVEPVAGGSVGVIVENGQVALVVDEARVTLTADEVVQVREMLDRATRTWTVARGTSWERPCS